MVYDNKVKSVGTFSKIADLRIIDLIGTIQDQNWAFADVSGSNPLDGFLLGFDQGTAGYVDFTNFSENSWSIASGQLTMGDRRHQKTVTKFKLVAHDIGTTTFTVCLTNELGQTEQQTVTIGTGTGRSIVKVLGFKVPGFFITWEVFGAAGESASFVEFSPVYDVGGEQRGTA